MYILLRDNMTSAHILLSRTRKAGKVVLGWAAMGPGETQLFLFFMHKGEWIPGDNWQCPQSLN